MTYPARPALLAALAASTIGAAPAAAPAQAQGQMQSFDFEMYDRGGVCSVGIPAGEGGLKIEFTIRASDLNVNVAMHNIAGDIVNAALDADEEPEIDLVFDGRRRHELDWGSYVAGFTYRAVGGWDDGNNAADALEDLKVSNTVTFVADNHSWGPIPLQAKGMAFNILEQCLQRNLKEGPK